MKPAKAGRRRPHPPPRADFEPIETIELSRPIHYAGEEIFELRFREPELEVCRVIERAERRDDGDTLPLLAYMTGIGVEALARCPLREGMEALALVEEICERYGLTVPKRGADADDELDDQADAAELDDQADAAELDDQAADEGKG